MSIPGDIVDDAALRLEIERVLEQESVDDSESLSPEVSNDADMNFATTQGVVTSIYDRPCSVDFYDVIRGSGCPEDLRRFVWTCALEMWRSSRANDYTGQDASLPSALEARELGKLYGLPIAACLSVKLVASSVRKQLEDASVASTCSPQDVDDLYAAGILAPLIYPEFGDVLRAIAQNSALDAVPKTVNELRRADAVARRNRAGAHYDSDDGDVDDAETALIVEARNCAAIGVVMRHLSCGLGAKPELRTAQDLASVLLPAIAIHQRAASASTDDAGSSGDGSGTDDTLRMTLAGRVATLLLDGSLFGGFLRFARDVNRRPAVAECGQTVLSDDSSDSSDSVVSTARDASDVMLRADTATSAAECLPAGMHSRVLIGPVPAAAGIRVAAELLHLNTQVIMSDVARANGGDDLFHEVATHLLLNPLWAAVLRHVRPPADALTKAPHANSKRTTDAHMKLASPSKRIGSPTRGSVLTAPLFYLPHAFGVNNLLNNDGDPLVRLLNRHLRSELKESLRRFRRPLLALNYSRAIVDDCAGRLLAEALEDLGDVPFEDCTIVAPFSIARVSPPSEAAHSTRPRLYSVAAAGRHHARGVKYRDADHGHVAASRSGTFEAQLATAENMPWHDRLWLLRTDAVPTSMLLATPPASGKRGHGGGRATVRVPPEYPALAFRPVPPRVAKEVFAPGGVLRDIAARVHGGETYVHDSNSDATDATSNGSYISVAASPSSQAITADHTLLRYFISREVAVVSDSDLQSAAGQSALPAGTVALSQEPRCGVVTAVVAAQSSKPSRSRDGRALQSAAIASWASTPSSTTALASTSIAGTPVGVKCSRQQGIRILGCEVVPREVRKYTAADAAACVWEHVHLAVSDVSVHRASDATDETSADGDGLTLISGIVAHNKQVVAAGENSQGGGGGDAVASDSAAAARVDAEFNRPKLAVRRAAASIIFSVSTARWTVPGKALRMASEARRVRRLIDERPASLSVDGNSCVDIDRASCARGKSSGPRSSGLRVQGDMSAFPAQEEEEEAVDLDSRSGGEPSESHRRQTEAGLAAWHWKPADYVELAPPPRQPPRSRRRAFVVPVSETSAKLRPAPAVRPGMLVVAVATPVSYGGANAYHVLLGRVLSVDERARSCVLLDEVNGREDLVPAFSSMRVALAPVDAARRAALENSGRWIVNDDGTIRDARWVGEKHSRPAVTTGGGGGGQGCTTANMPRGSHSDRTNANGNSPGASDVLWIPGEADHNVTALQQLRWRLSTADVKTLFDWSAPISPAAGGGTGKGGAAASTLDSNRGPLYVGGSDVWLEAESQTRERAERAKLDAAEGERLLKYVETHHVVPDWAIRSRPHRTARLLAKVVVAPVLQSVRATARAAEVAASAGFTSVSEVQDTTSAGGRPFLSSMACDVVRKFLDEQDVDVPPGPWFSAYASSKLPSSWLQVHNDETQVAPGSSDGNNSDTGKSRISSRVSVIHVLPPAAVVDMTGSSVGVVHREQHVPLQPPGALVVEEPSPARLPARVGTSATSTPVQSRCARRRGVDHSGSVPGTPDAVPATDTAAATPDEVQPPIPVVQTTEPGTRLRKLAAVGVRSVEPECTASPVLHKQRDDARTPLAPRDEARESSPPRSKRVRHASKRHQ